MGVAPAPGPFGGPAGFRAPGFGWSGWAVSQHTPVSLRDMSLGDMYSGVILIGQFMTKLRSLRNSYPCRGLVKKTPIMSSVGQCLTVSHPWSS